MVQSFMRKGHEGSMQVADSCSGSYHVAGPGVTVRQRASMRQNWLSRLLA